MGLGTNNVWCRRESSTRVFKNKDGKLNLIFFKQRGINDTVEDCSGEKL